MIEQHRLLNAVAELVDAGVLRTTLAADGGLINVDNLKRVHGLIEGGKVIGKIVLTGFPPDPKALARQMTTTTSGASSSR